jgi:hypothetical protein
METRLLEAELFHAKGRKDKHDGVSSLLSQVGESA